MISRSNIAPDKYRSFLRNTDANVAILTGFILPVLISSWRLPSIWRLHIYKDGRRNLSSI